MKEYNFKAKPIWPKGLEKEMNLQVAFRTFIKSGENIMIALTASTVYRLWVNNMFVGIGPARTAKGIFKVDEYDIGQYLTLDENEVIVEVVGYNVNSYYTMDQPSFLQAQVVEDDQVIAYTGGSYFDYRICDERVRKVQRYSYQRPFSECYHYPKSNNYTKNNLSVLEDKRCIYREIRYPAYEVLYPQKIISSGQVDFDYVSDSIKEDRSYTDINDKLKGYKKEDLDEHLSSEYQNMSFAESQGEHDQSYKTYEFPFNATGLIAFSIKCDKKTSVYALFDELLIDGDIDTTRADCCNGIKIYFEKGDYDFISFEPYTFKYLKLVSDGNCSIENIRIIEYKHEKVDYEIDLEDEDLKLIYQAGLEIYLSNAVDVFTDCPSRERAGWLCDSFFIGRVEYVLTGENILEKSFLENIIYAHDFPHIPAGMIPMNYPADHYRGGFIPNWGMWFILELEEYFLRTGDRKLVDQAKQRVYDFLNYLENFENDLGLLENLKGWVFVEWSKANDLTQDINYPSNMVYYKMLRAIGKLYGDHGLLSKSLKLRQVICKRSFNGEFFTDNEVRKDVLINPNHTTEVCQYYAFFTGIADKESHKDLWLKLMNEFGPNRKKDNKYPKVYFANAFIGNYLRLELLYKDKRYDQVLQEMKDYFLKMARTTGTLWEKDEATASCNHGFASHVIYWLNGIYNSPKI
ncbi:hypothetical protein EZV73_20700 [Acidaminobacter sp. JC074]|uniref:alpha-L-rhamnosidase-related protein n=1 Tax=Acidaminobacter sp. JC074 TaxID=2530199 RepID=UPI001F0FDCDB|nr:hypothetical protein [Acidaminobacter sp. JC074]MCH4890011.1 hypothetical protein [Acidaminobacter sp. JC074]